MIDPRTYIIGERLREVKRIITVASGKGGVGKSLVSATLSLLLSSRGKEIGLLDLDFHGPSCHIILGATDIEPLEEYGIVPPRLNGVKFMTIAYYIGDEPAPLRGEEISNVFIELLSVTRWGKLDYLIIDAPPGIGDEIADIVRLVRRCEFILVTTPSKLSLLTVERTIKFLKELRQPVIGLIENMVLRESGEGIKLAEKYGIKYLGSIPYTVEIEDAIGSPSRILETVFSKKLAEIAVASGLL